VSVEQHRSPAEQHHASAGRHESGKRAGIARTAPGEVRVRRALISVTDKTGIVEFARGLVELGVEIVSTGGTARALSEGGVPVRAIEDFTGFPEMMDGRVKTLHPRLYAGLLALRDEKTHLQAAAEHAIEPVDLVCVNLYRFEDALARGASPTETVENIDIGGPTMIRAAAKNSSFAAVVVDPGDYEPVLAELRERDGRLSNDTRMRLRAAAFACTARYDAAISRWCAVQAYGEEFPPSWAESYEKTMDLRYGENPHQSAAYYAKAGAPVHLLSGVRQLHGKELSFNNLLDLSSARELVEELSGAGRGPVSSADHEPPGAGAGAGSEAALGAGAERVSGAACAIVKHNNPCGCAVAGDGLAAYERAFACDSTSAFGGVIAINRTIDLALAQALSKQFVEVLLAPRFDAEALELLSEKKNVRLLELADWPARSSEVEEKHVLGGVLAQTRDVVSETREQMQVAGSAQPSEEQWDDLLFAWKVCRHVRSNAIVIATAGATIGIGAGQMSRVDAVRIAVEKARAGAGEELLAGSVLASDAFFPFADGPQLAIDAGVRAIVQPGGSVKDDEVLAAANAAGVAMVTTGTRHFRH
jgi:phosphoribosylaminoimidazolecarboxamide formyltransferase / IMP cyclohydrolase